MKKYKATKGKKSLLVPILVSLAVLLVTGLASGYTYLTTGITQTDADGSVEYSSSATGVGERTTAITLFNKGTVTTFTKALCENCRHDDPTPGQLALVDNVSKATIDLTTTGSTIYIRRDAHSGWGFKETTVTNQEACVDQECATVADKGGVMTLNSTTTHTTCPGSCNAGTLLLDETQTISQTGTTSSETSNFLSTLISYASARVVNHGQTSTNELTFPYDKDVVGTGELPLTEQSDQNISLEANPDKTEATGAVTQIYRK